MKNSEERKSTEATTDVHGRIESLDQSIRSVDSRLRAVEKRLSIKIPKTEHDADLIIVEDVGGKDIHGEIKDIVVRINNLQTELTSLQENLREIEQKLVHIDRVTTDAERRITKLENLNKITIGKIKVPIELSGLVAAIVLLGTGYLISADQWSIIRSSYYPVTIGILFGVVVIVKFMMTNRE